MRRAAQIVFGAHGQVVLGFFSLLVTMTLWPLGTAVIPGAAAWPWHWTPAVYIFHVSMFALWVASMGYIGSALGYRATERVEAHVVENIEQADIKVGDGPHDTPFQAPHA